MPPRPEDVRHSPAENASEIGRLRKRQAVVRSVLIGSLAFIPLGCLGGCGLSLLVPNDTARAVFGIFGVLAPFIGLGALLLMWGDRGRYGRSLELANQADALGLAFRERPTPEQYGPVKRFQLFAGPTHEFASNLLAGRHGGADVLVLDYSCAWGSGRWAYTVGQTVFIFEGAAAGVPDLIVSPKGVMDKLSEFVGLGGGPLPLPGQDAFNRAYALSAERGKEAVARFSPELAALCVKEDKLALEVSGGAVLAYWLNAYVKPGELPARLETALRAARLLRREG
jgi:hypothetical protein